MPDKPYSCGMEAEGNAPASSMPAQDETRRDFIKKAGIIAAGGAALAALPGAGSALAAAGTDASGAQKKPLKGRRALITGGARGIGLAIASRLAQDGADIALLDIADAHALKGIISYPLSSAEDLERAGSAVAAHGGKVLSVIADVRDRTRTVHAVNEAAQALGGLDIIVANAGISNGGAFGEESEAVFKDIIAVNVTGVANSLHAAAPHLRKSRQGGRMIAISSVAGRRGVSDLASYSTSKWAVIGLVKSLALELGKDNITVNAIAPTAVDTALWHGLSGMQGAGSMQAMDMLVRHYHSLPTGALSPEDIAAAAAFLASDNARYVSGMTLDVNAGWSAQMTG